MLCVSLFGSLHGFFSTRRSISVLVSEKSLNPGTPGSRIYLGLHLLMPTCTHKVCVCFLVVVVVADAERKIVQASPFLPV